jgi:hypothetical protein
MMRWAAENPSAARQILKRDREVTTNRRSAQRVSAAPLILAAFFAAERMSAQAQNMDGQSGGFFQPWANVVPSGHRQSVSRRRSNDAADGRRIQGRHPDPG